MNSTVKPTAAGHPLTLKTYGEFLIGRRVAIEEFMNCKGAFWLGLVFVMAAGFAREYDGESLTHEPWHLFIPLGASIASSFILYALLYLVSILRQAPWRGFITGYRKFLTLYWMTAPLAFVYGIPAERLVSPGDAMRVNLFFLAVVATWRVVLMIRIAAVLYKSHWTAVTCPVMLFANGLALAAISYLPLPILDLMGGIRLTESEGILRGAANLVFVVTFLLTPIWFLLTLIVALGRLARLEPWGNRLVEEDAGQHSRVSLALWGTGGVSIVVWLVFMPWTQMEQFHRYQVSRMLLNSEFADAVAYTRELEQSEFPPHWDPPPAIGYGENADIVDGFLAVASDLNPPQWLLESFEDKKRRLEESWHYGPRAPHGNDHVEMESGANDEDANEEDASEEDASEEDANVPQR